LSGGEKKEGFGIWKSQNGATTQVRVPSEKNLAPVFDQGGEIENRLCVVEKGDNK